MKLSGFLRDVGDQIVFYYPKLRPICGSVTATLLLCRLAAWDGYQRDPDGWIEKTSDEIEQETGMSYREQVTAREHLKERGLLEEKQERLAHKMFYRINFDALDSAWDTHIGSSSTDDSVVPETRIRQFGKRQNVSSLTLLQINDQIDSNTDDATHHPQQQPQSSEKKKPKSRPKPSRPEFETEPEVFLHQRLVKHYSGLGFVAPVAWQNATQQETFVAYASKMSRNELDAFITWYLNNNKYKLSEIANGITTWGSKKKPAQQKETLREKWEREGRI